MESKQKRQPTKRKENEKRETNRVDPFRDLERINRQPHVLQDGLFFVIELQAHLLS